MKCFETTRTAFSKAMYAIESYAKEMHDFLADSGYMFIQVEIGESVPSEGRISFVITFKDVYKVKPCMTYKELYIESETMLVDDNVHIRLIEIDESKLRTDSDGWITRLTTKAG